MPALPGPTAVALAGCTTFRLGGPCRAFFDCRTAGELCGVVRDLLARQAAFLLIGGGSNLLVADAGVDAAVVRFAHATPDIRRTGDGGIEVGAATSLDDLARWTVEQGIEGFVHCSGIPGTVGGAIAGNAGAFGEQIGDRVQSVSLLDAAGHERTVPAHDLGFAYRRSRLQDEGGIVLSALLRAGPGDAGALRARREEILALRASKHPDLRTTRTAGSFFKNIEPTSKAERRQAAGWFLEQAGAKDLRVGGARTYDKHANIIIAEDGCTAADVLELSRQMAARVCERFGLTLQREVRLVGDFGAPSVRTG